VITAIDSSVLLDVLGADATFGPRSGAAIRACLFEGRLAVCDIVMAETASFFPTPAEVVPALATLGVDFDALGAEAALLAGSAWSDYRSRGGSRTRVVADFLIGAHASVQADRLLTRDRGFFRTYFAALEIVDPSEASERES
jgi:predicted nucleic acid-binding protein